MSKESDPTKDPEFQKVVQHLLSTPPKPHSAMKLGKRKAKASVSAQKQAKVVPSKKPSKAKSC
jgi:hypothetical protein